MLNAKSVLLTLILCLPVCGALPQASAETVEDPDVWFQPRQSRYDTMRSVKEEITGLINENKQLEEHYSLLKEQWESRRQQNAPLPKTTVQRSAQQPVEQKPVRPAVITPVPVQPFSAGDKPQPLDSRSLKGEVVDPHGALTLLELYLADLRYQRRELELDLKLHKVKQQDRRGEALQAQTQLKNEIQSGLIKERQLMQALQRKQEEVTQAPQENIRLKKENSALERELPALQKKVEFKDREIEILKNKITLQQKSADPVLSKEEKERQVLEARIKERRERYESLSKLVGTSLRRQERKKQLLRDIIAFDKENQDLQEKIVELNDKIHYQQY
ncbi:MAG: hypothetical protein K8I00_01445 [Candidatus Omnitrophica bacterium]|nr:hypothetical protein [Candidatus Omnitrophota bacterium]